jgi:hypothetical protein
MEVDDPGGRSAEEDYKVGYKKPPLHTRFKEGQPRPPRRPKPEEPTSLEFLAQVLSETRTIRIDGKKRKMANYDIILHRLAEKAPSNSRLQALHYKLDAFLRPPCDDPKIPRVFISDP